MPNTTWITCFKKGITLASFNSVGNIPSYIDLFYIIIRTCF